MKPFRTCVVFVRKTFTPLKSVDNKNIKKD